MNKVMSKRFSVITYALLSVTVLSGLALSSSIVSADDSVVDDVSITVPTSCTMRGTGMNSHNATINNGTYNSEVGTTTLKAFCNNNDGFAIYAIGYTNNTDGNTVLASQTLGSSFDIATGTQTSGNSQWAMKLATDSNATYPIELQNGFGSFHTIPDDYALVAKRTAGTDIDTGESATGSTLTTTYQVYISNTQSADTYTGKVKYVMVHPNNADEIPVREDRVAVIFDGNGLTFPGGISKNRLLYEKSGSLNTLSLVNGAYAEPTDFDSWWYTFDDEGSVVEFYNETDVEEYLDENFNSLLGASVKMYAYSPFAVVYDGNGATAGTMDDFYHFLEYGIASEEVQLLAYNFKKTGYGFAGWSEKNNAKVNSNDVIYGPNEVITGDELTFDATTHVATLYAVWVKSSGDMQGFNCGNLPSGQITALTDTRDGNVYTIRKMEDDRCWMMENLRLDAANSTDSSKAHGFGGVFTGLADSEDTISNSTTANSRYDTSIITGDNQAYRIPRYNNNNTNIGGTNSAGITLTISPWDYNSYVQWYGYGNYYNWPAAMASTDTNSKYTSICPTGWFLPSATGTGSFAYLDILLGGDGEEQFDELAAEAAERWTSYPHNLVYSGYWGSIRSTNRGNGGEYWTRTSAGSRDAYYMGLFPDYVYPKTTGAGQRYNGKSVRCIDYQPVIE